jgi:hypothetical protein
MSAFSALSAHPERVEVGLLDRQSMTGCGPVRTQQAARLRFQYSVESDAFKSHVVVEVLEMPQVP